MKITGHIICQYPEVTGTYMGTPYAYKEFIVEATEPYPNSVTGNNPHGIHDRFTLRAKNAHLDSLRDSGALNGGDFIFTVFLACDEKKRDDQSPYPQNRMPLVTKIEPRNP